MTTIEQISGSIQMLPLDDVLPSLPARQSSASITASEMQANAGIVFKRGASRTENMPEELRLQRVDPKNGRALPAEDFVELAVAKVEAWPEIGDDKAVTVAGFRRRQLKQADRS